MSEEKTQADDVPVDRRSADIGIICSNALEIQPLLKKLDRIRKYVDGGAVFRGGFLEESVRVAIVEAGSGFARHRQIAETLVSEHNPAWVLSVGFSSPLSSELTPGDICMASEICDVHGNTLPVKCPIPESKRIFVRKHVVADQHPATVAELRALAADFDAAAVDTTSLAVAQACQSDSEEESKVRFLSVRGIVGQATDDLPPSVVDRLFQTTTETQATSISGLWKRVKPDPIVAPWKKAAEETAINLNKFLLSIIEQLGEKLGRSVF